MIGTIFAILGIAALSVFMFALGAVSCALGAYAKIKDAEGEPAAKEWLGKMRDKSYGR
jgi:hypothetical protein